MERKIIVVGMDNTGKTTLVNQLSDYYQCDHIKSLGPGYSRDEMLWEIVRKITIDKMVVLERFSILEECVYGKVLRNDPKFTVEDMDLVKPYNPLIVYCRPSDEVIYNFGDREQMDGVIEQREKLVNEWDHLISQLKERDFEVITYDWTKNSLEDITRVIGERDEYNSCKKRGNK